MMKMVARWLALLIFTGLAAMPMAASARLQCVPFARDLSGVEIYGNARTWWGQADGRYARGNTPRPGAVMAFKASGVMPLGHVAYVDKVIGPREVLLDHANWSRPGGIERSVRAIDVSEAGDWSEVRVWHSPTASMGIRVNAVYGFIYNEGLAVDKKPSQPLIGRDVYQLAALELSSAH